MSTKQLVMHHQICRSSACAVCVPVRASIAEDQRLDGMRQQEQQQSPCTGYNGSNGHAADATT